MGEECLFCRIARGEVSSEIVYQDDQLTAFRDVNPQAPTHILIIPNEHIPRVSALEDSQLPGMGKLFGAARDVARREGLEGGYRLVVNNGPLAGQSVDHLHLHLLGGRAMRWPPG